MATVTLQQPHGRLGLRCRHRPGRRLARSARRPICGACRRSLLRRRLHLCSSGLAVGVAVPPPADFVSRDGRGRLLLISDAASDGAQLCWRTLDNAWTSAARVDGGRHRPYPPVARPPSNGSHTRPPRTSKPEDSRPLPLRSSLVLSRWRYGAEHRSRLAIPPRPESGRFHIDRHPCNTPGPGSSSSRVDS